MIIQVRGTSGSGKTTVMRIVMRYLIEGNDTKLEAYYIDGRKKPVWYGHPDTGTIILGHYESTCGGCDNIGSAAQVYDLAKTIRDKMGETPVNILSEGLLLSEDTKWTTKLHQDYPEEVRVIFLTTPVEVCVSRVLNRREEDGNSKPFNPSNTVKRFDVIERARVKLSEAGVWTRRVSSRQAPEVVVDLLRERDRCVILNFASLGPASRGPGG